MVGCGFLRPDLSCCRKDTPKSFKQLCIKCCQFKKDDRPLFPQVSNSLLVSVLLHLSSLTDYVVLVSMSCLGGVVQGYIHVLTSSLSCIKALCYFLTTIHSVHVLETNVRWLC